MSAAVMFRAKPQPCRCARHAYPHRRAWQCDVTAEEAAAKRWPRPAGDLETFKNARDTAQAVASMQEMRK